MPARKPPAENGRSASTSGGRPRDTVMHDVARLAGVSHQTVSRVLNDHPNVRAETRQRVLDAMHSLNYRPNLAARTLATRQSRMLGLIAFETDLFGPASMLYGIETAARDAGYLVSIATVRDLERRPVLEAVDRLAQHAVEGIIAIAPKITVVNALMHARVNLPCVAVGGGDHGESFPTVRVDNAIGARLATQHLLDLGHATVHHAAGPADWPEAQARIDGWRTTLYEAGAVVPPVQPGAWEAASGYAQGRVLAADPSVTAIFCANDRIALGLLRALHEAGRSVPGAVSLVGFDDMPDAEYFLPSLSTVRQNFGELARHSVEMLLDRLRQPVDMPAEDVVVAPQLILRASTSPPLRS